MKRKVLVSVFVLLVLCVVTGCGKTKKVESDISSFSYSYGSYNNGYYNYNISVDGSDVRFTAYGYNGVDLNIDKKINGDYLNKLAKVIDDNKIYEWNGFNNSDEDVLDGNSFHLKIEYKNGKTINASGYMKYPDNYKNGHNALKEFLGNIK